LLDTSGEAESNASRKRLLMSRTLVCAAEDLFSFTGSLFLSIPHVASITATLFHGRKLGSAHVVAQFKVQDVSSPHSQAVSMGREVAVVLRGFP
jgi:hypothetical protein